MRTITYSIHHWTNDETGVGDCFEVIEQECLHLTTGDVHNDYSIASFCTRPEAEAFIKEIL